MLKIANGLKIVTGFSDRIVQFLFYFEGTRIMFCETFRNDQNKFIVDIPVWQELFRPLRQFEVIQTKRWPVKKYNTSLIIGKNKTKIKLKYLKIFVNAGCLRCSWIKELGIIHRWSKLRRQRRLGPLLALGKRYRVNVKSRPNDKKDGGALTKLL